MLRYIIKRLIWMIPVILGVVVIVFTISYFTPGDPAAAILGPNAEKASYEALRAKLGLDRPFLVQLGTYIWNIVSRFDLGKAYITGTPISEELIYRLPTTIKLGVLSIFVTVALGTPLGILSATKQYSIADYSVTTIALIVNAIPSFVLALFALMLFSVKLRWLPIAGVATWDAWILPIACNSLGYVALSARMTRTSMLEVIRQDYIRTARAKGLKQNVVIRRHALPNALIPIVTVVGTQLSFVLAGAIIVETIFSIPGMGMYILSGISGRDYPVINGTVLVLSVCVCVMNLLVDIAYAFIDPRIKALYMSPRKAKAHKSPKTAEVA
ncbi:MAG: ABC transporter permease [Clostridiales bacterium]|nr:ABC transporter permease [Clostridiales bacterium]